MSQHLCRGSLPEALTGSLRSRIRGTRAYLARPPIATERLSLADGKVVYQLRRHWRDGTAAVTFDPLTFIERLAARIPRPRCHQLTYHGVLASAAQWRDLVVPRSPFTAPGTPAEGLAYQARLRLDVNWNWQNGQGSLAGFGNTTLAAMTRLYSADLGLVQAVRAPFEPADHFSHSVSHDLARS